MNNFDCICYVIQYILHQDVADPYPDLRRFLDAIYEKANLSSVIFNQRDIVSRCIDVFVSNGFRDEQSVVEACEFTNCDDLVLREANIPFKLVAIIYKTILEFRKKSQTKYEV